MTASSSHHLKGLVLTAVGGLALTFDIPLVRLSDGDAWPVLMLRTGTTVIVTLLIWLVWRRITPNAPPLLPGWTGVVVAVLYGLCSLCFITAIYHTSTANLVFIIAFTTMFSTLLSWMFLKERPKNATLIAMAVMIVGVLVIVADGLRAGSMFGDLLALCAALFLASAITISRYSRRDMGFTPLIGVIIPFAIALAGVAATGYRVEAPWWIVLNGAIVMPISFFCLGTGPKYLSAPEVAMFYLLETVLAPVWVWIIFNEVPSGNAMIGGTILIAALVAHSLWQLIDGRRRRVGGNFRHPA